MAPTDESRPDRERFELVGRFVDDDVVEVATSESRWLLDLTRRRFQRCRPDGDARRALRFGRWSSFTRVDIDGGCLVVERRARPTVRAQVAFDAPPPADRRPQASTKPS
jgi:hypothetical protein